MKSRLSSKITQLAKQKQIPAVVIDVLRQFCTVRLSSNGQKLTGIKYFGSAPVIGDSVFVDYSSGVPLVYTSSANLEAAIEAIQFPTQSKKKSAPLENQPTGYHNDLDGVQGGVQPSEGVDAEFYHLTEEEHDAIGGMVTEETDPVFTAWDKDYDDLTNKPALGTAAAEDVETFAPALGIDDNYVSDAGLALLEELEVLEPEDGQMFIWVADSGGGHWEVQDAPEGGGGGGGGTGLGIGESLTSQIDEITNVFEISTEFDMGEYGEVLNSVSIFYNGLKQDISQYELGFGEYGESIITLDFVPIIGDTLEVIVYSLAIEGIEEAPIDGSQYARKDAGWEAVAASDSGVAGKLYLYSNFK